VTDTDGDDPLDEQLVETVVAKLLSNLSLSLFLSLSLSCSCTQTSSVKVHALAFTRRPLQCSTAAKKSWMEFFLHIMVQQALFPISAKK
jgi:hypothetical protein